jgi:hypothetical protein
MRCAFALVAALALPAGYAPAQTPACCTITTIEAASGLVTGKVTANGNVFQFKVSNARTLAKLRVGQGVFANFTTRQVSLDGRNTCCAITSGPTAAPVGPPVRPAPAPAPSAVVAAAGAAPIAVAIVNTLPTISYGPPQPRTTPRSKLSSRFDVTTLTVPVAGKNVTGRVLNLRGLKAVEQAPDLDPGARRVLEMLVRRVPRGQSDHYIVNTQLAKEWIAAHPVPDKVKPTEPKEKKCGNWYDSWDCATEAVSDEWQRTYDHAVDEWKDATKTLADAWQASVACFEEKTLSLPDIPIKFSITPAMTVNLEQSGARGSAKGTLKGSAGLGVPMQGDLAATLDLFYIPCLPFAIRPKALAATGSITVSQELTVSVTADGSFNKTFTIPPSGGPVIPIQVFPIIIGGVPVAELDVSAYIEGNIEVSAEGKANGGFQLKNSDATKFAFSCGGGGCSASSKGAPAPNTASESAQIEGTVSVKPAIYTALQLDFNYEALSARAGPQPYLLGTASGCAAAAGSQTSAGASTVQENHVLAADLDWGVELRAEALVLRKVVGSPFVLRLMKDKHLWFRDVAPGGSNALVAQVATAGPAVAGQRSDHKVKMPSCYPYTNRVKYEVNWTGGATPAPDPTGRSPACSWQTAQGKGSCSFDPAKELVISLIWPTAGTWSLTVVAVGDTHDRVFTPAPKPTQVNVTVAPAGGGAP